MDGRFYYKIKVCCLFCATICSLALAGTDILLPRDRVLCDASPTTNWDLLSAYHSSAIGANDEGFAFPKRTYVNRQWAKSKYLYLESTQYRSAFTILPFIGGGAKREDSLSVSLDALAGVSFAGWIDSLDYSLRAQYSAGFYDEEVPRSAQCAGHAIFWRSINHNDKNISTIAYDLMASFHYDWLQVGFERNSAHWGPGFFNNLALNQHSYPYYLLNFHLTIGPLRVSSLYGNLRVAPWEESNTEFSNRSLFAHRYELLLGNLTLGISETQVIYDNMNAWLFVPVVPLFMEKGNYSKKSNNGAIAFDANYRLLKMLRLYTEFYLDDMESPISLVKNDNIEAKWAWMVGTQFGYTYLGGNKKIEAGSIIEYSRVEPYVYTHFFENTAQMAHAGKPLGNPNGPNSMTICIAGYVFWNEKIFVLLNNEFVWKGLDKGSSLNDESPLLNGMNMKKYFLKENETSYALTLSAKYQLKWFSLEAGFRFFFNEKAFSNVVFLL